MDRYLEAAHSASPPSAPAANAGYPTNGNPQTATPASEPGEWWFHMVTEEIRAVIAAAGLTPDHATVTQLAAAIPLMAVPAGTVIHVAKNSAPAGYLKANGAAVSRTTYAALFAAIGTTFGAGDGSTTFNLPDLRGEFVRGWDDGRGADSGRSFGSWQADEFESHTHDYNGTDLVAVGGNTTPVYANYSGETSATGGSETRPRNVALLACIKY